jgi:hypothetical protein
MRRSRSDGALASLREAALLTQALRDWKRALLEERRLYPNSNTRDAIDAVPSALVAVIMKQEAITRVSAKWSTLPKTSNRLERSAPQGAFSFFWARHLVD